jgi:hypothetical protein
MTVVALMHPVVGPKSRIRAEKGGAGYTSLVEE